MANILVIDDSPEFCRLVALVVEGAEHTCIEAYDAHTGLNLAETEQPDLIVLDYMMPLMDGLEAFKKLRQNPRTAHIPVIMITAFSATEASRIEALRLGMDDYLTKPVSPRALLDSISGVLYRRHSSPRPAVD